MEFGVYIRSMKTFPAMVELSQHAESLGYYGVFLNDHVHGFADNGREPYLEAWTAMTGIGVLTSRIRIGHTVLFNSLRNPAFLAKSIATLDVMTNGRYEILFGAGWNEPEYVGYDLMEGGRGMPSAKERVDRFEEAVQILKGMLHNEVFSFEGKYWKLKDAINIPQPVQKPIRISVGASKPRMIRIAAKYADGFNIGGGLDEVERITSSLSAELEKHGKSLEDFYISGFTRFGIAKNEEEYDSWVKEMAMKSNASVEAIRENAFVGTKDVLIEKIRKAQDMHMKLLIGSPYGEKNLDDAKQRIEEFKDEIINSV